MQKVRKSVNPKNLVLNLAMVLFTTVYLFPIYWMVTTSLKHPSEVLQDPPTLIPQNPTLSYYYQALTLIPLLRFIVNSLLVTGAIVAVSLLTSSLAGYAFGKFRFPGRDKLFMLLLTGLMIPFQVILIPLFIIMRDFGWINSFWALTVPNFVSIFGTFLVRQFMFTIPSEYIDAARVDGCSELGIYWRIIVPMCKPVLSTLAIFVFMWHFNEFLWPLIVLNDMRMYTLPLGLNLYQTEVSGAWDFDIIMAASTIGTLPILIFYLVAQKRLTKSIYMTGLKG